MTINEYRTRLFAALNGFDRNEVAAAVDYYTELLEDAENTEEQMAKLGTPEQLAQRIIADNGWNGTRFTDEKKTSASESDRLAGRIIALVLTAPFWITGFILIASLFLVIGGLYLSLPFGALAAIITGIIYLFKYPILTVAIFACGIISAGIGILLFRPALSAVFGLSGVVKSYTGFVFGKHFSGTVNRKIPHFNKLVFIIAGALILVGNITLIVMNLNSDKINQSVSSSAGYSTVQKDLESAENITADIDLGTIKVMPSDDNKVHITAVNVSPELLNITENGSDLSITYSSNGKKALPQFNIMKLHSPDTTFNIYLPKEELGKVNIDSSLGEIKMNDLTMKDLVLNSELGEIELDNITQTGSIFNIKVSTGELKLENVTAAAEEANSRLEANAGDIEIDNMTVTALNIRQHLGDVKIENTTVGTIVCENNCGDTKMENVSAGESLNCTSDLGDVDLELVGSDYRVTADTDLGDVKINDKQSSNEQGSGNIPVIVHNNCGDIEISYK